NDVRALFQPIIGRAPGAAELVGMEDLLATSGNSQKTLGTSLAASGSPAGIATVVTLTAPTGAATLTGQTNVPTLFAFPDIAFGQDTIAGFDPVRDTIQLPHTRVADLTTLQAKTTPTAAGGSLITLNPTQSSTLTRASPAH